MSLIPCEAPFHWERELLREKFTLPSEATEGRFTLVVNLTVGA